MASSPCYASAPVFTLFLLLSAPLPEPSFALFPPAPSPLSHLRARPLDDCCWVPTHTASPVPVEAFLCPSLPVSSPFSLHTCAYFPHHLPYFLCCLRFYGSLGVRTYVILAGCRQSSVLGVSPIFWRPPVHHTCPYDIRAFAWTLLIPYLI